MAIAKPTPSSEKSPTLSRETESASRARSRRKPPAQPNNSLSRSSQRTSVPASRKRRCVEPSRSSGTRRTEQNRLPPSTPAQNRKPTCSRSETKEWRKNHAQETLDSHRGRNLQPGVDDRTGLDT